MKISPHRSVTELFQEKTIPYEGLTYDDVLLLPGFTDFKRSEVQLKTVIHPKIVLTLPVISSPMDTVTEDAMAIQMAEYGGLGIIHRNLDIKKQADMVKQVKKATVQNTTYAAVDEKGRLLVGAAVGTGTDFDERVEELVKAEVDIIVIDSGHGNTQYMVDGVKKIKKDYPHMVVMAGNVATYEGAKTLIEAGADSIRVGMGPGSICTTRVITGMGVPQLTAVQQAVLAAEGTNISIIADGGIKQMGDMAKALAFGAQAVMLGSLLARFEESPGTSITIHEKKYKQYRGMGSVAAMKKGGAERYGQSKDTDEKKLIPEGVEGLVEMKGRVKDYLFQIAGSLKSSLYYIGARTLEEYFVKARYIKITNASLIESHPHSIVLENAGVNYNNQK
ncbi:IMP dehydrogenase [Candidatus Roizmanbacteria bacterium]|nr:IMP dehydrogenase [Candidatus Roizmanbacteria bacterium]